MSVRSIFAFTFLVFAALLGSLVCFAFLLARNQKELVASEERRYRSYKLADELRQTSDDLTRLARTYVATGDPVYEEWFHEVVRIRDGDVPRPDNYDGIYWDFVLATGQRPGTSGDPVSLEALMRRMNFTKEEFLKLQESKAKSDALVLLEEKAMNAVKGRFNDAAGEPTVVREPDPEMARLIMFGKEYHQAKAEIMKPISDFMVMLDERMARDIRALQKERRTYAAMAVGLAGGGLAFTCLASFVLYRRVMVPVRKLVTAADLVESGQYGQRVDHSSSDELGNLALSFNHMSNAIKDDIAELEEQKEEIREKEKRFRTLVANLPGTVYRCLHDEDWTMQFISDEVENLTGYPPTDFIGNETRTFDSVIHEDDRAMVAEEVGAAVSRKEPWAIQYRIVGSDGELRWVGERGRAVFREDGEVDYLDGVIADITDSKRIEEELHTSNFLSDIALELTHCGFWHVDYSDPDYYYQSERAARMLGEPLKPDRRYHLQDEWFARLVEANPETAELTAERYQGAIDGRYGHYESTYAYNRPIDGEIIWLHALGKVVRDEHDRIQYMYGVYQDVTQRLASEKALREATHAAEAATRAKSEFLASMSHELRTPLNGILGYAQILQRDKSATEKQRANVDSIISCGDHLLALINDVLDLSKIEAGRLELQEEALDLDRLIRSIGDIVGERARAKGLEFVVDVAPEIPQGIIADAAKIRQVLVNLLGNAVKFTDVGSVTLRVTETPEHELVFEAIDTGVGMEPHETEHIFDPFKQVEAGKAAGGTGLGLSISRRLVEKMGGELGVESEKGKGSCFRVKIPYEEADEGDLGSLDSAETSDLADAKLAPEQEVSILVADDRVVNRNILEQMLVDAGFLVSLADDGDTALEAMRAESFDLVLMDVRMPRMNGIEAVRRIRNDAALKELPVIAVTASVFPEFREKALAAGFDDFLPKPFRVSELMRILRDQLDLEWASESEPQETQDPPSGAPQAVVAGAEEVPLQLPEDALDTFRSALKIKNISALKSLAKELVQSDSTKAAGAEIERLTGKFDFGGLASLLDKLSES